MKSSAVGALLLKMATWVIRLGGARAQSVQCPTGNLNPLVLKGKRFFDSVSGAYFPIKGIAYYPRPNDGPLSITNSVDFFTDEYRDLWETDIEYLRQLGVNTIRIYAVDPSRSHDNFMCTLQQAGIYAMVGLLADCLGCAIGPDEAPSCYPSSLKTRGQWIINEFSKYSNTIAFSAGNEVTLYARDRQIELNAACQKKFLRDMRSYVDTCGVIPASILPRQVPIGMVNWDNQRELQTLYFNCRTNPVDELENSEWYGLNAYQHCDTNAVSVEDLTGWSTMRSDFERYNLSIPVIVSEYGCRERFPTIGEFEAQRNWLQVDALYSEQFVEQFAGGIVFEYSAEKRIVDRSSQRKPWPYFEFMKLQYGVGFFSPVDCDHGTTPCEYSPYPEFDALAAKFSAVDLSSTPNFDAYLPRGEIPECPIGLPSLSDFIWPTDLDPGFPCYTVPTNQPTLQPSTSIEPSFPPSNSPSDVASSSPTDSPSMSPSLRPNTQLSTPQPTVSPVSPPTTSPSFFITGSPISAPTASPSSLITQPISNTQSPVGLSLTAPPTPEGITTTPRLQPTLTPTSVLETIDGPAALSDAMRPTNSPTMSRTRMPFDSTIPAIQDGSVASPIFSVSLSLCMLITLIAYNLAF